MPARITHLEVSGFRSIGGDVEIAFPAGKPLVLVGENNAGKSNIIKALELVQGDRWPRNWEPEDHDFYDRDPMKSIRIVSTVSGVTFKGDSVHEFELTHANGDTDFNVNMDNGSSSWGNQECRRQLPCHVIDADRRLGYELSYTSKWTLLSKLMTQFHKTLTDDEDRKAALKAHFDGLHQVFEGVPEYADFVRRLQSELNDLSGNMPYRLDIDFSAYDPSNYFRALRVTAKVGADHRSFEEIGTGQEQVLALGFAYAYAAAFGATGAGLILVIEEPESHLHPLAQRWLAAQLHRFTADGVQVVVTTHSPAFIDIRNLDGLVLVRRGPDGTEVKQQSARVLAEHCRRNGAGKASPESVFDHYDINATDDLRAGLFARAVVLVEGRTEEYALPSMLAKLGLDLTRSGIACIPVAGKGNLAKWHRFFTSFEIPTYVIFDNDTRNGDADGARRCDVLGALGVAEDRQPALLATTHLQVEETFAVMGIDFENCVAALVPAWNTKVAASREANGKMGKPFEARWVAERLSSADVAPLQALADAIATLVPQP